MMELLEEQGLSPEIDQVPARRPEERAHALWNLYVPEAEVSAAQDFLRRDWADLVENPEAAAAAERGQQGVDLDRGGENRLSCLWPPLRREHAPGGVPRLRPRAGGAGRGLAGRGREQAVR